jgi:hypothetical protein
VVVDFRVTGIHNYFSSFLAITTASVPDSSLSFSFLLYFWYASFP